MLRWRNGVHPVLTAEGGAVLDERTGVWTHLTGTAAAAAGLLTSADTDHAAAAYAARYRIPVAQAGTDLTAVARTLTTAGLLVDAHRPPTRRWWWWR